MIDLIVLNYNDCITTSSFIENTREISLIDHIIVVDNCSTDDSYKKLKNYECKKIDVIRNNENSGYAAGNNFGVFHAVKKNNPDYLIISNPDVVISKSNLENMLKIAKTTNNLGCITVKMRCTSGINLPIAWKLPKYKDCLLENFIILRKLIGDKTFYSKYELRNDVCNVDVVPGSFFMIETKKFLSVNGFDENTFLYYEENILAYKLKKENLKNFILMNEEYIHNHSVSINKSIKSVRKRLNIAFESRMYYCEKYLEIGIIKKTLLKIAFIIGCFNYLLTLRIMNKER